MKRNFSISALNHGTCIFVYTSCMLLFGLNSMFAQSVVTNLKYNNQSVQSANTTVMLPGNGGSSSVLKVGDQLQSGTRLIIPPYTIVMLQSPAGRQICSSIKGKTMEYTVKMTPKGENHYVRGQGAQVKSYVNKSVGYNYRVNNGRGTTSAARGTEFTFTDMSAGNNEQAIITTEEGSINIIDQVPLSINGQSAPTNKRGEPITQAVSRMQSAGDQQFYSSDQPIEYADYSQAISYISNEIYNIIDPEERADNLLCLGDLYMDFDQPQNAVDPFNQARLIFEEYYGPDDLYTLEAVISMSEAIAKSGDVQNANAWIGNAYNILVELANWNVEDLNYLDTLDYFEEEDHEAYDIISSELSEIYGLIGWAYEVTGDVSSEYYYDLMSKYALKY
ncbi:hypothetical protein [Winogradskyella sp. A2]|uniref:hypothetical protein n=1 Tax=Winogradskyella sp. A2 TaxID=3366944 RepID=UPI00398C6C9F